jgi:aspartate aminotransferase
MTSDGFDPFAYAHAHRREIVWMSQNTNHLVPPEPARAAIRQALEERRYEGYPMGSGLPELRSLVVADLGLPVDTGCLVSAGGTEALYMLARALLAPGDEVIASDPSYLIIHKFIELSGARPVPLDIYAEPYRMTSDRIQAAITPKTKMILLIDPLNPLGSGYPPEEVRAIAEIAKDHRLWLLNDITYRDFADRHTLAYPFHPEQTLTVWSVSKNCGLAGLRIGGLAARADVTKTVGKYNTNDLGVNILAQVAAVADLSSKSGWIDSVRATTRANQATIRAAVSETPGTFLPVYPSQANMFAIDISATGIAPESLQETLLRDDGVFVRAGNYLSPRFGGRFVRASFSNPPGDVAKFAAAFPNAVERLRPKAVTPRTA